MTDFAAFSYKGQQEKPSICHYNTTVNLNQTQIQTPYHTKVNSFNVTFLLSLSLSPLEGSPNAKEPQKDQIFQ